MDICENMQKKLEDLVKSKQALLHRNKRKDAYSLSPDRLLNIYQNYFANIHQTGNYTFKFSKNDKNDLYPLDLNFCKQCSNSQLSVAVPSDKMFNNYVYQSSTSKQFRNHFEEIAKEVKIDFNLNKKSLVVDIGSNDGIFLKPLKDMDVNAIGVEPAKNISKIANAKGLKL